MGRGPHPARARGSPDPLAAVGVRACPERSRGIPSRTGQVGATCPTGKPRCALRALGGPTLLPLLLWPFRVAATVPGAVHCGRTMGLVRPRGPRAAASLLSGRGGERCSGRSATASETTTQPQRPDRSVGPPGPRTGLRPSRPQSHTASEPDPAVATTTTPLRLPRPDARRPRICAIMTIERLCYPTNLLLPSW